MRRLVFLLILSAVAQSPGELRAERPVVQKLRTYCKACHGLGTLRFLYSEDDDEVWRYLFEGSAPNSKKSWAEAIITVLSWPSASPPPFDQPLAAGKDWMPKGQKRLLLAEDHMDGESTRLKILESLKAELENLPLPIR